MKHLREHEVAGEKFEMPYAREIRHLVAPWTVGSTKVWVGTSTIEPGASSNQHKHDDAEEVFYILSGTGRVQVGDEEENIGPGSCIYIPPTVLHELINDSNEKLKLVSITAPPFTPKNFKDVHTPSN